MRPTNALMSEDSKYKAIRTVAHLRTMRNLYSNSLACVSYRWSTRSLMRCTGTLLIILGISLATLVNGLADCPQDCATALSDCQENCSGTPAQRAACLQTCQRAYTRCLSRCSPVCHPP